MSSGGKDLPPPPAYQPPPGPGGDGAPPPGYSQQQPTAYPPHQQGYAAHPPQPGYPGGGYPGGGPPPPHSHAVHNQSTTVVLQPALTVFGDLAVSMTCPYCQANMRTTLEYRVSTLAWIICLILFLFGFWLCCCIPFCIPSLRDVIHKCPNCHNVVGQCRRM